MTMNKEILIQQEIKLYILPYMGSKIPLNNENLYEKK